MLYILSAVSSLSLVFIALNFVFSFMGGLSIGDIFYYWLILVIIFTNYVKQRHIGWQLVSIALLIVPFVFLRKANDIALLVISSGFLLYFIFKGLDKTNYGLYIEYFKKGIWFIGVIFIVSLLAHGLPAIGTYPASFAIIYVFSSVIALRTLRHLEYIGSYSREIDKINIKYFVFILFLSFFLSLQFIREFMLHLILKGYLFMVGMFSWVLYYLRYAIEGLLYLAKYVLKAKKASVNHVTYFPLSNTMVGGRGDLFERLIANHLLSLAFRGLVILLGIFLLTRLFPKSLKRDPIEEEYVEYRESTIVGLKTTALANRLSTFLRPRSYNERIRHYYIKYLKLCRKKNIEIRDWDTSFDVNEKARKLFDRLTIEAMRDIYIKIRYGNHECDQKTVREFYEHYQKISKIEKGLDRGYQ